MFEDAMHDVRYALRMLRRSPAMTAAVVLSLALGIGANTAIFSVIDVLMLHALPVKEPDRLVLVGTSENFTQYSLFETFRERAETIADLTAIVHTDRYNVPIGASGGGAAALDSGPVRVALVSGNYFSMLGVDASVGRVLAGADDEASSAHRVAVISDAYWDRRFARAPDVVGRTLTITGQIYEVVGVAPNGFTGEWVGRPADVWIPVIWQPLVMAELPVGGLRNATVTILGRLKRAITIEQARAALQIAYTQQLRDEAGSNLPPVRLQALMQSRVEVESGARGFSPQRRSFGQSLTILMIAVGLVLLVACANIANLLLARSASRQRELTVRRAVGASRGRLVRQLLTESVVLSVIGGVAGLIFAQWATATLAAFVRLGPVTNAAPAYSMDLDVHPNATILAFTAALCAVTGVLAGLAPAFRGSQAPLSPALTGRGPYAGAFGGRFAIGKLLVVSQVALSIVLLIGAALFARTLRNLTTQDLGFDREHVLLVWTLPGQTDSRGAAAADFWHRVQERLSSISGVVSVGASNQGILNGSEVINLTGPSLRIDGEPPLPSGLPGFRSFITPGFFKTLGTPLVAGRDFAERDTAAAPRGVIISEAMARHYFGSRPAVGHRIWFSEDTAAPTEIIGVVKDFAGGSPRETRRSGPTYFSYRDKEAARRLRSMTIAVRTAGDPLALAARIRQELRDVELQLPVLRIDTIEEQLNDVLVQERLIALLSSFFGLLALLLACVGLYGVVSYAVTRRTAEIGVRLALGATRGRMLRTILQESLTLVAVGVAIGLPIALALTRLLGARLFGVSPADPPTIAAAVAVMVLVAALASVFPARRAARVDPMVALRCD